ncbi:MAG: dihydropteroate synthase [Bacteroidota bacterium]|nr:dihydropteroate synthase [Bacteroidota bacterium]
MLYSVDGMNRAKRKLSLNIDGQLVNLNTPLVMGILNVTPDSFFDGGKYSSEELILKRAEQILEEGGSFIDIGAYSTRPGAAEVTEEEEIARLLPAVQLIKKHIPGAMISIDTWRAEVARRVITECGSCIINDISGGTMDEKMFETVATLQVPYILMHIKGTPQTMQNAPSYKDITGEVIQFLSEKVSRLHQLGVHDVILDPGFGFGKTIEHNYELMNHLDSFDVFQLPLLVGISRKSMIFRLLETTPEGSLNGTTVLNSLALLGGANILRVHDVKEASEAVKIVEKLKSTLR